MSDIKIKYNDKERRVDRDGFIVAALRMLDEFGLNTDRKTVEEQITKILHQQGGLNIIGVFLQDYIVLE